MHLFAIRNNDMQIHAMGTLCFYCAYVWLNFVIIDMRYSCTEKRVCSVKNSKSQRTLTAWAENLQRTLSDNNQSTGMQPFLFALQVRVIFNTF